MKVSIISLSAKSRYYLCKSCCRISMVLNTMHIETSEEWYKVQCNTLAQVQAITDLLRDMISVRGCRVVCRKDKKTQKKDRAKIKDVANTTESLLFNMAKVCFLCLSPPSFLPFSSFSHGLGGLQKEAVLSLPVSTSFSVLSIHKTGDCPHEDQSWEFKLIMYFEIIRFEFISLACRVQLLSVSKLLSTTMKANYLLWGRPLISQ